MNRLRFLKHVFPTGWVWHFRSVFIRDSIPGCDWQFDRAKKTMQLQSSRARASLIFHPRKYVIQCRHKAVECNNLNALGVHISIRRTSRRHLVPNGEKNDRRTTPTSLASREQGERSVTEIKRKRAHWSDRDNEMQWERERARIGSREFDEREKDRVTTIVVLSLLPILRFDPYHRPFP